jgi:hypothetical protein
MGSGNNPGTTGKSELAPAMNDQQLGVASERPAYHEWGRYGHCPRWINRLPFWCMSTNATSRQAGRGIRAVLTPTVTAHEHELKASTSAMPPTTKKDITSGRRLTPTILNCAVGS